MEIDMRTHYIDLLQDISNHCLPLLEELRIDYRELMVDICHDGPQVGYAVRLILCFLNGSLQQPHFLLQLRFLMDKTLQVIPSWMSVKVGLQYVVFETRPDLGIETHVQWLSTYAAFSLNAGNTPCSSAIDNAIGFGMTQQGDSANARP